MRGAHCSLERSVVAACLAACLLGSVSSDLHEPQRHNEGEDAGIAAVDGLGFGLSELLDHVFVPFKWWPEWVRLRTQEGYR